MAAPDKVSVLDKNGNVTYHVDYDAARTYIDNSSIENPLIQIWADLDERILLLDGANIWIAPGVTLYRTGTTSTPTIESPMTGTVKCNIYGYGKIKNETNNNCILIDNDNATISISCDYLDSQTVNSNCIRINHADKFHLNCNYIYSKGPAITLGSASGTIVNDTNIEIIKVETGDTSSSPIPGTSIVNYANGFMNINDIVCKNNGHCLLHRRGSITALIKTMTGVRVNSGYISTILIGQGDSNQNLVLYFDEIKNILGSGSSNSTNAIEIAEGKSYLIGRKIFSNDGYAVSITQPLPPPTISTIANLKCNDIECYNGSGVFISNVTQEVIIDSNIIKGYSSYGAVYGQGIANFLLKNATLRNRDTTSNSKCIVLEQPPNTIGIPTMTLNNVKCVTNNIPNGYIIFQAGFTGLTLKNYGLYSNKVLDTGISLTIGTTVNHFFIISDDLT